MRGCGRNQAGNMTDINQVHEYDESLLCVTKYPKLIYIIWYNLKCDTARGDVSLSLDIIIISFPKPAGGGRGGVCLSQDNDYPGCAGWPGAVVATTHHTNPLPLHHHWIGRYHYMLYKYIIWSYDHWITSSRESWLRWAWAWCTC